MLTEILALVLTEQGGDPNIGVSITSLIGSLGAAGAAVAVVYYFLGFLKEQDGRLEKSAESIRQQLERQSDRQDQIQKSYADRQDQSQKAYQDHIERLSKAQEALTREMIESIRSLKDDRPHRSHDQTRS
jgi:uncharacterized protein HemX